MARVGLLSFSDGRSFVNRDLREFVSTVQRQIEGRLRADAHEVVTAQAIVEDNELACREARRVAESHPDLTIYNFPVWAFPHFSELAATETAGPILLFSNISPKYPGMVGMLAAAGWSVSFPNGSPGARAAADYVTRANYARGFVEGVRSGRLLRPSG